MKKIFTIKETGEVITANIESITHLSPEQVKKRLRENEKHYRMRFFFKFRDPINKQHNNKKMIKTYYIKDTGEKIVADVEGDYELSEEDRKKVEQARKKARLRLFSNPEKETIPNK